MTEAPSQTTGRTIGATVASLLLFIPGLVIGGILAFLYRSFLRYLLYSSLSWLPFYDVIETVTLGWFGNLIHGLIAALFAVNISTTMIKQANVRVVSWVTAGVWLLLLVPAVVFTFEPDLWALSIVEVIAFAVGITFGALNKWDQ